jgi:transmembrane sensor
LEPSQQLKEIFERYLSNDYTAADLRFIHDRFQNESDRDLLSDLIEAELQKDTHTSDSDLRIDKILGRVDESLLVKLQGQKQQSVPIYKKWYTGVAASLLLISFAFFYHYKFQAAVIPDHEVLVSDVLPGGNKATLTLASGRIVELDHQKQGLITSEAGVMITKAADGQLVYEGMPSSLNNIGGGTNTISTPNGGQFQVLLPDGTEVWLNAASSLTYSTSFSSMGERRVRLIGEGYFQVAHNKSKPFIVETATQQVKVLGTHFNINSYTDEGETKTTLLEGAVELSSNDSHVSEKVTLKRGQQSVQKKTGFVVDLADEQTAVAWMKGRIYFKDASIESIMRQVARWYDIDVVYKGALPERTFDGGISRKSNLSILLKILELQNIHFTITDKEGRKVLTVMP